MNIIGVDYDESIRPTGPVKVRLDLNLPSRRQGVVHSSWAAYIRGQPELLRATHRGESNRPTETKCNQV